MYVAPFTGAWVEMFHRTAAAAEHPSHPSRVRGLKYGVGKCDVPWHTHYYLCFLGEVTFIERVTLPALP